MANITDVTCSLATQILTVSVQWDTPDTGTLTIYDAGGSPVEGTITSPGAGYASWQPSSPLSPAQPYSAQVVIAQVPSNKVPLLWNAPTAVVSVFDGQSVTLSWTAPVGFPNPGSFSITISDGTHSQVVISPTTKVIFSPSPLLTFGEAWTVKIEPTLGVSTGPAVTASIVTATVAVASVACTANGGVGQISITPATTTYTSFLATLSQNGNTVLSQNLTYTHGTPMNLPVTNWPLSPVGGYEIVIQPVSGSATGPQGGALPVIVTAPVIVMAAVAAGSSPTVSIEMALPPGSPHSSGFSANIMNGATNVGSSSFNGTSGTVTLTSALSAGTYVLTVSAIFGPNSSGPSAQVNLLTTAPAITAIDNDAGIVKISFTGATGIPNSQVDIAVGGTVVTSAQTTTSLIQLPAPAVPFTVTVRGAAPGLLGPAATSLPIITAAPAVKNVTTASNLATVTVDDTATKGIANVSYQGYLYQGETLLQGPVTAKTATGVPPTVAFTTQIPELSSCTVRVQALAGNVTGPKIGSASVIDVMPEITSVVYDGTNVRVNWAKVNGAGITAYKLSLYENGSPPTVVGTPAQTNGTEAKLPLTPTTGKTYYVVVQATSDIGTGPQSKQVDVITAQSSLTEVSYDGTRVSASWPTTAGITGYHLVLLEAGIAVRYVDVIGTNGYIDLSIDADNSSYSVALQQVNGLSVGPDGPPLSVLPNCPQITAATTSATTGVTTLTWGAVTGATTYTIYQPGLATVTVPAPATSYDLPVALVPNSERSATIAYSQTTANGTTGGPQSKSFVIPTGQPRLSTVDYDGINVTATWEPVSDATGYVATLIGTKGGSKTVAGSTPPLQQVLALPLFRLNTPETGTTYTVVVQAMFNGVNSGPVSNSLPIFKPAFFLSTAPSQTAAPYFYPATALATVASPPNAEEISLYFPELGSVTLSSLPINIPVTGPSFVFQANPGTNSAVYPYQLLINTTSPAWAFDTTPIRSAIKTGVPALLTALENAGASPWGLYMVQDALSRYLPQTFQESLFLAYGMNGSTSSADLRPGMVLRVESNSVQSAGFSSNQQYLNGYAAGSTLEYQIGSKIDFAGNWSLGFNSFIGELVSQNLLTVNPPDEGTRWNQKSGVADAADLYYSNFPSSFYRLLPPQVLVNTTAAPNSDTTKNFVIAAANKYKDIAKAVNTTGGVCPVAYFRGRAIISLAIRVTLNGNEITVPVGTTVANLLERSGNFPALAKANLQGLAVTRSLGSAVTSETEQLSTSNGYNIRFDWRTLANFNPGWSALCLPLLPGDQINTKVIK